MSREPRAVIFDLDDTLYPYRRFRLSGFAVVAQALARRHGLDGREVFRRLARASRGPKRGVELQECFEAFGLPFHRLPNEIMRVQEHTPSLRLSRAAVRMLLTLRHRGWKLGVLTNGPQSIQARKVAALGLGPRVDAIVYATEHGFGTGKPDLAAFEATSARLGVRPSRTVFVGDDERCDIEGSTAAGMRPVKCAVWEPLWGRTAAPVVVTRLSEVPGVAHALLLEDVKRHVA